MQFIYTEPQTELEQLIGGYHCINAFGKIELGDDRVFKSFLENANPPPRTTIYINSTGGNVEAAIGIGRLIRDGWYSTQVGSYHVSKVETGVPLFARELIPGKCLSAATLIFLGGKLRYFANGSDFGVHQFSYKDPSPENLGQSQILSAKIAQYIVDMEIPVEFLEISSSTPSSEISVVGVAELLKLGIVTGGVTDAKWSVQARGGMIYVRGERDTLFGHHKVLLAYTKSGGFSFWAFVEAQGREMELTTFGLVEIVVNGENIRLDVSQRCQRVVSGIYVMIVASLSEVEARMLAFSESFGVQVRFSSEAGMFLGISAVPTDGGKEELGSFFKCLSSTES